MRQLTVRGFDRALIDRIRRLANQEGISLNQAVLKLLRRGAGIGAPQSGRAVVGASLDHLIGTWTPDEADAMDRALADLAEMDESMGRRESCWTRTPTRI